ncbi:MAG: hypothetical protein QOH37_1015 [Nocardioidaceae bacterium]|nr:hypothetical protein [Nocardioidaceae bacterium]
MVSAELARAIPMAPPRQMCLSAGCRDDLTCVIPSQSALAIDLSWLPSVSRHLGEGGFRLVVDGSRSGLSEVPVLGL